MDAHAGALLASARPGHSVNTGGGQPPLPTVPYVHHYGAVVVPKRIAQVHSAVQEGGGAEATAFGDGGGKGGDLKGIWCLWAHPRDGPILQVPRESDIGGG